MRDVAAFMQFSRNLPLSDQQPYVVVAVESGVRRRKMRVVRSVRGAIVERLEWVFGEVLRFDEKW